MLAKIRPLQISLRWRLTVWYLLTLAVILVLFSAFLYWQLQRSLYAQMDTALQAAASQALINIDADGNTLAFQNIDASANAAIHNSKELTFYLWTDEGAFIERLGAETAVTLPQKVENGYTTQSNGEDSWRIYTQAVITDNAIGWIQIAQDLETIDETLEKLLNQMTIGIPLALALAGLGGYFLAA